MIKKILLWLKIIIFAIFAITPVLINTSARSNSQQNLAQSSTASSGSEVDTPTIPKVRLWNLAFGTNITDGGSGTIFQAQNGDLYAMGWNTGLQVLKGGELTPGKEFEKALGTNITKGQHGTIFQAQNDDLYAMGKGTGLQVLKGGELTSENRFITALGTNITKGQYGAIFQARNGDLYAMGYGTKLQVLKGGKLTPGNQFEKAPGTTITNGGYGTIFQAQNDDLYAMGAGTELQVLKGGKLTPGNQFETALGIDIFGGGGGTIFQARNGDLYAMRNGTELQVLKGGELTSEKEFEKAPETTITNGGYGTIFQAQNGDLYAMGYDTGLQVLKGGGLTPRKEFEKAPGTNITKGQHGTIFQAQNGDLYAMGYDTRLQVLKGGELTSGNRFITALGTNITKGQYGTIFQAQNGDLYAMGYDTRLQVLKGGELTSGNRFITALGTNFTKGQYGTIFQTKNGDLYAMGNVTKLQVLLKFIKTDETEANADDGTITITNFNNDSSKLQYKKVGVETWTDLLSTGIIQGLSPGKYQFQWRSKNGEHYDGTTSETQAIPKLQEILVWNSPELVANAIAKFKSIYSGGLKASETNDNNLAPNVITRKRSSLPSELVGTITADNLGITEPSPLTGVTVTYSIASYDDTAGTIVVQAIIALKSDSSNSTTVYFKLDGYTTIQEMTQNNQKAVNDAANWFKEIGEGKFHAKDNKLNIVTPIGVTGKSDVLPSTISPINPTNLGIENLIGTNVNNVNVAYTIASGDTNDNEGTMIVTATISKGDAINKIVYFKLSGFLTSDQQAVDNLATKFETSLKAVTLGDPTESTESTLEAKATTLPSTLIADPSPSSLGFIDLIAADVNVAYEVASDDATGTMIVTATISKGDAINKIVYFKLSGFLTSDQQAVDNLATKFETSLKGVAIGVPIEETESTLEAKATTLPSTLIADPSPSSLGFIDLIAADVNVAYEAASDDDTGTMIVTATISKGDATNIVKFKLSGFLTSDQQAVNNLATKFKEATLGKLYAKDSDVSLTATSTGLTEATSTLPSQLSSANSPGTFGFTEPSITGDVNVVYVIQSHSDAAGTLVVKATISKGEATNKIVYFKLDGYQTTTQRSAQVAVDDVTNWFKGTGENELHAKDAKESIKTSTNVISKSDVLPSTISPINPTNLGIENLIGTNADNVNVVYATASGDVDDNNGTIIVIATISKGSASPKVVYFKLSGYLTNNQKAVNDAFNVINGKSGHYNKNALEEITTFKAFPSLKFGINTSTIPEGVAVSYKHLIVNTDGVFQVRFKVTKGAATKEFNKDITASGFSDQNDVDNAFTIINRDSTTGYNGSGGIIATVDEWTTFPSGKFDIVTSAISSGVTMQYKHPTINSDGAFQVSFKVIKGTKSKTFHKNIMASGFSEENIVDNTRDVNAAFRVINNANGNYDGAQLVEVANWTTFASGKFGIDISTIPDGVAVDYKHSIVNSDGVFQVKFKVAKGTPTKEFIKEIIASGFSDQSDVDRASKIINDDESTGYRGSTSNAITVWTTFITETFDIDISVIPTGVIVKYQHPAINKDGAFQVSFQVSKNTKTTTFTKNIMAFGFTDQKIIAATVQAFKDDLNAVDEDQTPSVENASSLDDKTTILPSRLIANPTSKSLGFILPTLQGANVAYQVLANNGDGTMIVTATISKGTDAIPKVIKFKLSGYSTQEQANQRVVARVVEKFKTGSLKAKDDNSNLEIIAIMNKEWDLPSNLASGDITQANLGFTNPTPLTDVNVVYLIPQDGHNDNDGTIVVQANISSLDDSISDVVYFKLSGYLTSNQKAVNDAMKVINDANGNYDGTNLAAVTDWTTFTSGTFGIDISPIPSGVTVEYLHPVVAKDKSFTISFKVTKGSTSKEFTKEINVMAKKDESNNAVILGTTIPIGIIFLAGVSYLIFRKMKKK